MTLSRSPLPALACAAGLALGACAGFAEEAAANAPAAIPTPASAGCTVQSKSGIFLMKTTDGAARVRSYIVFVPSAYTPQHADALAFVFHGAGGTGAQAVAWGLQRAKGAEDGIFVFPNGIPFERYGVGWDDSATGYDLPFFDHMRNQIEAAYCIDPHRVYAAGFSWGGDFAVALACHRGDVLDGIVANSTDDEYKDPSNYMSYQGLPCASHRHPRIRFEHAIEGDAQYPAPDFATTSRLFRYMNACSAASTPLPPRAGAPSCAAFGGCANEYVECSFDRRIGHALPPGWAQNAWDFLAGGSR